MLRTEDCCARGNGGGRSVTQWRRRDEPRGRRQRRGKGCLKKIFAVSKNVRSLLLWKREEIDVARK
eukprot:12299361-Prorocentrum_lima.AAC.1